MASNKQFGRPGEQLMFDKGCFSMAYREIWHEMIIKASPSEIYQALTDVKKLAHWWTTQTQGESVVGKKLEFWFYGEWLKEMVVTTLKVDELVQWRATE